MNTFECPLHVVSSLSFPEHANQNIDFFLSSKLSKNLCCMFLIATIDYLLKIREFDGLKIDQKFFFNIQFDYMLQDFLFFAV